MNTASNLHTASRPHRPAPAAARAAAPAYKWWVVVMLWFICFFNYADRQAIYSVFPKLKDKFGFDHVQLGLIGSAFMWVYAAGAPLAGFIGDRTRRKDLILGSCLFWSFVTVTTGWCAKLRHFVTVRALEGFGETFYFPASMSLISDYHGRRTRSRALSFHQSSVYVGTILGSWASAWFAQRFAGGRMLVQAFGLAVGAASVFLVGKTANTRTLLLAMTCFGVCKGFYDSGIFASLYDAIEPRARGSAAGLMNTVGWGGGALGPLFVGFASKYGGKPTEIENMSDPIAFGGVIYLVAAALVVAAMLLFVKHHHPARRK